MTNTLINSNIITSCVVLIVEVNDNGKYRQSNISNQTVNIMTEKSKTAINEAIAKRVNSFRKQYGMSLDELAKSAEISKGMLVQIEKGRANPSIEIGRASCRERV